MRIGILGAGQLGRMLALSGIPLGHRFVFVDPNPDNPASHLGHQLVAECDDAAALRSLAEQCEVVTCEFEHVPEFAARTLTGLVPFHPNARALATAQDRLIEKETLRRLGIPTAPFRAITRVSDLAFALDTLGKPSILKTRRFGYDGKGQRFVYDAASAAAAFRELGRVPSILEGFVGFEREVSLIAARARDGSVAFYPLVENLHHDGILRLTLAPAPRLTDDLQRLAQAHVRRLMEALDYVGVITVEFFQLGSTLIANEFAPRVHNSGHWSIEGAETSQFENHLRAITGLPLGGTKVRASAAMVNLVGALPEATSVLDVEEAHLHVYDKQPQPNRKVGHLTVLASSTVERAEKLRALVPRLVTCGSCPKELNVPPSGECARHPRVAKSDDSAAVTGSRYPTKTSESRPLRWVRGLGS